MKHLAALLGEALLNLLYPRRCPVCDQILLPKEGLVCSVCRAGLPYIRQPFCMRCGKQLEVPEQEYCADCGQGRHLFVQGRAVFRYEKGLRRGLGRMKFQNRREYLDFYGEAMAGAKILGSWRPKVILPVPMYGKKARARGYDQSRLLARRLGRHTGIPVEEGCVVRTRRTLPQKELDARQRRANVKGAFVIRHPERIREPVLLVDDIYTTGATMDAVCQALQEQGITRIYFLVLAAGRGR